MTTASLRVLWIGAALLMAGLLSGCVQRQLRITSNVPDVQVMIELDGVEVGYTPVTIPFDYYGTREWVARPVNSDQGTAYETAWGRVELEAPWYEYFPFDFVSEVLLPFTIEDDHELQVILTPMVPRDMERVLDRAEAYREQSNANRASLVDPRDPKPQPQDEAATSDD